VYRISSESPEFCRIYYKKHFGLFFLDTVYTKNNKKKEGKKEKEEEEEKTDLSGDLPVSCYRLYPPSPFITISQPES